MGVADNWVTYGDVNFIVKAEKSNMVLKCKRSILLSLFSSHEQSEDHLKFGMRLVKKEVNLIVNSFTDEVTEISLSS